MLELGLTLSGLLLRPGVNIGGEPCPRWSLDPETNIRVTCDASPSNDRSESTLEVNPTNPYNMIGSSKRFTNPLTYAFSLAAYATFDGGQAWQEAAPLGLLAGWDGVSDPTVAFDDVG